MLINKASVDDIHVLNEDDPEYLARFFQPATPSARGISTADTDAPDKHFAPFFAALLMPAALKTMLADELCLMRETIGSR
jgi:hypothetical protein